MNLVKWDPFRELEEMSNRLNRVFGRDLGAETKGTALWAPPVDVKENNEAYILEAELPDMKKEDIKIEIRDGVLTLMGERKREAETKGEKYHRVERSYGTFTRSFSLPDNVDPNKVVATYDHGVLDIMLAKTATTKPRNLEIKIK